MKNINLLFINNPHLNLALRHDNTQSLKKEFEEVYKWNPLANIFLSAYQEKLFAEKNSYQFYDKYVSLKKRLNLEYANFLKTSN